MSAPTFPGRWVSRRSFADPFERFRQALAAVHGEAQRVADFSAAAAAAREVLRELQAGSVVLDADPLLDGWAEEPGDAWTVHRGRDFRADPHGWRLHCAAAGAGTTGAEALLAETGTVVVSTAGGRSRLVSLLPPVHLVLAPLNRMTTDLFTWLEARPPEWAANTVLVSGPSKTADIEQTMTVGVHGPRRLVVILFEEPDA